MPIHNHMKPNRSHSTSVPSVQSMLAAAQTGHSSLLMLQPSDTLAMDPITPELLLQDRVKTTPGTPSDQASLTPGTTPSAHAHAENHAPTQIALGNAGVSALFTSASRSLLNQSSQSNRSNPQALLPNHGQIIPIATATVSSMGENNGKPFPGANAPEVSSSAAQQFAASVCAESTSKGPGPELVSHRVRVAIPLIPNAITSVKDFKELLLDHGGTPYASVAAFFTALMIWPHDSNLAMQCLALVLSENLLSAELSVPCMSNDLNVSSLHTNQFMSQASPVHLVASSDNEQTPLSLSRGLPRSAQQPGIGGNELASPFLPRTSLVAGGAAQLGIHPGITPQSSLAPTYPSSAVPGPRASLSIAGQTPGAPNDANLFRLRSTSPTLSIASRFVEPSPAGLAGVAVPVPEFQYSYLSANVLTQASTTLLRSQPRLTRPMLIPPRASFTQTPFHGQMGELGGFTARDDHTLPNAIPPPTHIPNSPKTDISKFNHYPRVGEVGENDQHAKTRFTFDGSPPTDLTTQLLLQGLSPQVGLPDVYRPLLTGELPLDALSAAASRIMSRSNSPIPSQLYSSVSALTNRFWSFLTHTPSPAALYPWVKLEPGLTARFLIELNKHIQESPGERESGATHGAYLLTGPLLVPLPPSSVFTAAPEYLFNEPSVAESGASSNTGISQSQRRLPAPPSEVEANHTFDLGSSAVRSTPPDASINGGSPLLLSLRAELARMERISPVLSQQPKAPAEKRFFGFDKPSSKLESSLQLRGTRQRAQIPRLDDDRVTTENAVVPVTLPLLPSSLNSTPKFHADSRGFQHHSMISDSHSTSEVTIVSSAKVRDATTTTTRLELLYRQKLPILAARVGAAVRISIGKGEKPDNGEDSSKDLFVGPNVLVYATPLLAAPRLTPERSVCAPDLVGSTTESQSTLPTGPASSTSASRPSITESNQSKFAFSSVLKVDLPSDTHNPLSSYDIQEATISSTDEEDSDVDLENRMLPILTPPSYRKETRFRQVRRTTVAQLESSSTRAPETAAPGLVKPAAVPFAPETSQGNRTSSPNPSALSAQEGEATLHLPTSTRGFDRASQFPGLPTGAQFIDLEENDGVTSEASHETNLAPGSRSETPLASTVRSGGSSPLYTLVSTQNIVQPNWTKLFPYHTVYIEIERNATSCIGVGRYERVAPNNPNIVLMGSGPPRQSISVDEAQWRMSQTVETPLPNHNPHAASVLHSPFATSVSTPPTQIPTLISVPASIQQSSPAAVPSSLAHPANVASIAASRTRYDIDFGGWSRSSECLFAIDSRNQASGYGRGQTGEMDSSSQETNLSPHKRRQLAKEALLRRAESPPPAAALDLLAFPDTVQEVCLYVSADGFRTSLLPIRLTLDTRDNIWKVSNYFGLFSRRKCDVALAQNEVDIDLLINGARQIHATEIGTTNLVHQAFPDARLHTTPTSATIGTDRSTPNSVQVFATNSFDLSQHISPSATEQSHMAEMPLMPTVTEQVVGVSDRPESHLDGQTIAATNEESHPGFSPHSHQQSQTAQTDRYDPFDDSRSPTLTVLPLPFPEYAAAGQSPASPETTHNSVDLVI